MISAVLRGREHPRLGELAAVSEAGCALVLSRGGARKRYRHVDPNEDAVAFAVGPRGTLLAVADAHDGGAAAEIAVEHLIDRFAPGWTDAVDPLEGGWLALACDALWDTHAAVVRGCTRAGTPDSRTTLAFALIRPIDGRFGFGAIGDSHVFRAGPIDAEDVAAAAGATTAFLGSPGDTRESLLGRCFAGARSLAGVRAVVLATDGLSERGIGLDVPALGVTEAVAAAAAESLAKRAEVTARAVGEVALAAHRSHRSGDNIGVAATWLAD